MQKNFEIIEKYPDIIFWEITNKCNLRCKNCYNSNHINLQSSFESKDKVIDFLNKIPEKITVGFGGGEPLMVPYFFEVLQSLYNKNIKHHFTTNGLLLDESVADQIKYLGVSRVTVSLDGLKINHEYLRGAQTFDISLKAIEMLVKRGVTVYIGMTITRLNYNDILPIAKLGKELGVSVVSYFRYIPDHNRNSIFNHDKYSLFESAKRLLEVKYSLVDNSFNIFYERLAKFTFLLDEKELLSTLCRSINGLSNIDYLGNFYICPYLHKNIGNIWDEDLSDILKKTKSYLIKMLDIPKECEECKYSEICRGGCKGYSFKAYGDLLHKDACCFYDLIC
jgi:radical SAM protein with 4Fe4S-binding SPASM domain